jgi:hypothetical protein
MRRCRVKGKLLYWLTCVKYDLDHFNTLLFKNLLSTTLKNTYSSRIVSPIFKNQDILYVFRKNDRHFSRGWGGRGGRCSNTAFRTATFTFLFSHPSSGLLSAHRRLFCLWPLFPLSPILSFPDLLQTLTQTDIEIDRSFRPDVPPPPAGVNVGPLECGDTFPVQSSIRAGLRCLCTAQSSLTGSPVCPIQAGSGLFRLYILCWVVLRLGRTSVWTGSLPVPVKKFA